MNKIILPLLIGSALFAGSAEAQTPVSGPPYSSQGPYIGWNNLTGSTGETDFVNNRGLGLGGFVFMNTPSSGSPLTSLMILNASGNLGVGTNDPISRLTLAGSSTQNPNNSGSPIDYNGEGLTFINNAPTGSFNLGGIRIVQKNGYYLDNGDMVFTVGRTGGATLDAVTIQGASGYFGIGTPSPSAPLEINGNVKLTGGSGASMSYADGTVQSTAWTGVLSGGDYAESVDVTGERTEYMPGDVLVIDAEHPDRFRKASEPYSHMVAGIYSTKPGVTGRRQTTVKSSDELPMAMIGIVPTKVSTENGPVLPGDLLVASSTSGYAMKGTDKDKLTGAIIGKAMGHLEHGDGLIEVLVTLQ